MTLLDPSFNGVTPNVINKPFSLVPCAFYHLGGNGLIMRDLQIIRDSFHFSSLSSSALVVCCGHSGEEIIFLTKIILSLVGKSHIFL